ncbi:hypothetical protein SVAN01_00255 [Stagonosporopsis vannaccii]|nr:hypothetical protein SVAN01_00255 [Stagonosporopsis vannaccii]
MLYPIHIKPQFCCPAWWPTTIAPVAIALAPCSWFAPRDLHWGTPSDRNYSALLVSKPLCANTHEDLPIANKEDGELRSWLGMYVFIVNSIIVMFAMLVTLPYRAHTGEVRPVQDEVHCGVFRDRSKPIRQAARRKEAIATTSLRMKVVPRDYRINGFTKTKLDGTPIHRLFAP